MGGLVGRLFREFAVTLSVAIAVSMVVSLTTTPMMCAALLKHHRPRPARPLYRASERVFDTISGSTSDRCGGCCATRWSCCWSRSRRSPRTFTCTRSSPTASSRSRTPAGWPADPGRPEHSAQAMEAPVTSFADVVRHGPAVENVIAFTGGGGSGQHRADVHLAQAAGRAQDHRRRRSSRRLRGKTGAGPGRGARSSRPCRTCASAAAPATRSTSTRCSGDDLDELTDWAPQVLERDAHAARPDRRQQRPAEPRPAGLR